MKTGAAMPLLLPPQDLVRVAEQTVPGDLARYRRLRHELSGYVGTVGAIRRAWMGRGDAVVHTFLAKTKADYERHSRSAGGSGRQSNKNLQGLESTR